MIQTSRDYDIAIIRIDNPPVNALSVSAGLIGQLHETIAAALADAAVSSIILTGAGKLFSAGADINDFAKGPGGPNVLRMLLALIEAADKPIVAAIHGSALGGGLELAMATHYRVAHVKTLLGLPEVTLGLLPGGGGTQRLPRLIGAQAALGMMISGKPIDATKALAAGLIDRITEGDPVAAATAFLREDNPAPRSVGTLPVPADLNEAVAVARAKLNPRALSTAPSRIIDCVEAIGRLDFEAGLGFEADAFGSLMTTEASLGLRHGFFGLRQVARIPGLPATVKPVAIENVAIVGGGLMGTGIGIALLNAGLPVTLIEPQDAARERAAAKIAQTIARDVEKGRISAEEAQGRQDRLTVASTLDAAANADLVIEAVFEDMAVKKEVFGTLDRVTRPDTILASNTSTLDLNAIADLTGRPDRVVGLHFFSPANIMRLLEVVRGDRTSPETLATALAFAKRVGKVGVVSGVCDGFIGNRIFEEYLRHAGFLLEEGAFPQQIDAAMEAWGMAMGPFRTMDLAGQDIGWSIRKRRAVEQADRPYSGFVDRVCELGRFGQKTGSGIYLYPDGRTAQTDPEIDAMLVAYSAERGIERRAISDEEIVTRCLFAMVNEGARIVEEGIAYRPVDIDIIYQNGYGLPAERGGIMFQADHIGLPAVLARMAEFEAGRQGWAWVPAPLLVKLANEGRPLASLNQ